MTHTLHRQGLPHDLYDDFLVMAMPNLSNQDFLDKMQRFYEICSKYQPVNKDVLVPWRIYIFDDKEKVKGVLRDLADAQLGLSIVVSGVIDDIKECCEAVGLQLHTLNLSLGFWGNKSTLPAEDILEVTSMCGHSLISPKLVEDLVKRIRQGFSATAAADELARCCLCGIVNTKRCARLLRRMADQQ